MAALGSQTIASSYEQLLHVDADGGGNSTTHVSVKDGDNGTTFGFTIASDALMMSSTNRLEFGDTGTYIHQSADGVLDLVSDTELELNATTIDINGAVDISGDTTIAGDVIMADGKGIDFSADASPSAGMTAEILDDYEEGTWTGVVSDGTNPMTMHGSYTTGYYTKVGNLVTVSGYFVTTSLGSISPTSNPIRMTGLPFTAVDANAAYSAVSITYGIGLNITAGHTVSAHVDINQTFFSFTVWDATTGISNMTAAEWSAGGQCMISATYTAA